MSVGVVIAAAGHGKRMGKGFNKQFIQLGDRPMIVHTLQVFERLRAIDEIVVVTGAADVARCHDLCRSYRLNKVKRIVPGGETRQQSVQIGLRSLSSEWVLVHDGARPFVSSAMIETLLSKVQRHGAAVLGVPVKDTIKKVNEQGIIEETPDRKSMWAVQTPQAFRLTELKQAHEIAARQQLVATDDAMLMEKTGTKVHMVRGDYYNIKITTPDDLWHAEAILQHMTRLGEQS